MCWFWTLWPYVSSYRSLSSALWFFHRLNKGTLLHEMLNFNYVPTFLRSFFQQKKLKSELFWVFWRFVFFQNHLLWHPVPQFTSIFSTKTTKSRWYEKNTWIKKLLISDWVQNAFVGHFCRRILKVDLSLVKRTYFSFWRPPFRYKKLHPSQNLRPKNLFTRELFSVSMLMLDRRISQRKQFDFGAFSDSILVGLKT